MGLVGTGFTRFGVSGRSAHQLGVGRSVTQDSLWDRSAPVAGVTTQSSDRAAHFDGGLAKPRDHSAQSGGFLDRPRCDTWHDAIEFPIRDLYYFNASRARLTILINFPAPRGGVLAALRLARFAAHLRFTVPFGHCDFWTPQAGGIRPPNDSILREFFSM